MVARLDDIPVASEEPVVVVVVELDKDNDSWTVVAATWLINDSEQEEADGGVGG